MNYSILFEKRLEILKGVIRYIKDTDYHGEIMTVNDRGIIHRPRDDCSNENVNSIRKCIRNLRKLKGTVPFDSWKARVSRDTNAQIQFLGQCLLDRFYAKHIELYKFFSRNTPHTSSPSDIKALLSFSGHEYPLYVTWSTLLSSMRLRMEVSESNELRQAYIILTRLRLMISESDVKSIRFKDRKEEIKKKFNFIINKYSALITSKRWKQLIQSIESAERNRHSTNRFEYITHRRRMDGLLKVALSCKWQSI